MVGMRVTPGDTGAPRGLTDRGTQWGRVGGTGPRGRGAAGGGCGPGEGNLQALCWPRELLLFQLLLQ